MLGEILQGAAAIGQAGYNIFSGERNRADNLKQLQIQRDREDNAVQRRVEDLRNAGLSPTLAAGSPAAAAGGQVPQRQNISGVPESVAQMAMFNAQIQQVKAQTDLTRAEAERIRQYQQGNDPDYGLRADLNRAQVEKLEIEIQSAIIDNIGKGGAGYYRNSGGDLKFIAGDPNVIKSPRDARLLQNGLMDIAKKQAALNLNTDEEFLRSQVQKEVELLAKDLQFYDYKAIAGMARDVTSSILNLRNVGRRSPVHHHNQTINIP